MRNTQARACAHDEKVKAVVNIFNFISFEDKMVHFMGE